MAEMMSAEMNTVDDDVKETLRIAARPHPFPLSLATAALLVIDMQGDFCDPNGFCCGDMGLDPAPVRSIIPPIASVLEWARGNDLTVIFTTESHQPDLSDVSPSKKVRYQNAGYPVGAPGQMGRYLILGEPGNEVIGELAPRTGEIVLRKPAQSAFVFTDLEMMLRARGVTHVIVTGVTTECCVLATYRQASDLGFFALLLEDCCAAFAPEEHAAAIHVLLGEDGAVGWVSTSTELIAAHSEHERFLETRN